MSIPKIEPTTKVKEWVNRINKSFDEIRVRECCWKTVSVANKDTYVFPVAAGDKEVELKKFNPDAQYSVQYGGVILDPRDYRLSETQLKFVNGPPLENGYAIIVRCISQACTTILED